MRSPALENRTGRFARSVRVTDIVKHHKGSLVLAILIKEILIRVFEDGSSGDWANGIETLEN